MEARSATRHAGRPLDLLAAKLRAPRPRPEFVGRGSLVEPLLTEPPKRLTLVSAPPGYGKSTVLAEWVAAEDRLAVGWLSLDERESDPARFWGAVAQALCIPHPDAFDDVLSAIGGGLHITETVLPRVEAAAAALDGTTLLVLDDYHRIRSPEVHEQLAQLLERPGKLRLAIGTRADPPLHLGRLRVEGELVELRAARLRFTAKEADELLNIRLELAVEPDDIALLVARTEGWPAGVYLAGLSLGNRANASAFIRAFSGNQRHIADYLTAELLAGQPAEVVDFLLQSSILERLSGPLVDAVLESERSAARLKQLERSNLFLISLDDERVWYRYHHLFGDVLRRQLAEQAPEAVPLLHTRASAWYAHNGLPEPAIEHALQAEDVHLAADLIAEFWWGLIEQNRHTALARWLEGFPGGFVEADPRLCLVRAWVSGSLGRPEDVPRWLDAAERGTYTSSLPDGRSSLESAIVIVRGALAVGDVGAQVEAGRQAVELEQDGTATWRGVAEGGLGIGLFYAGAMQEAREHLANGAALLDAAGQHLAYSIVTAYRALAELEREDRDTAAGLIDESLARATMARVAEHPRMSLARVGDALLRAAAGDIDAALLEAERGAAQASGSAFFLDRATVQTTLGRVLLMTGDIEGAQTALEEAAALIDSCSDPGILPLRLAEVRQRLGIVVPVGADGNTGTDLTDRELEVLAYLPGTLTQRQIGDALFVSFNTVNSHVKAIYRKLGVSSRRAAVERSRELELLE